MRLIQDIKALTVMTPWLFDALAFGFGAIIGSFVNVCALRMPQGRSVVSPGSSCACGAAIPSLRNIPIISWLVWGRKSPCCGRAFSPRYAIVESVCGLLFLASWILLPWPFSPVGMVFCALLLTMALIDIDTMSLPDSLNIGLGLLGVIFSGCFPGLHGRDGALAALGDSLGGLVLGTALVYWFRLIAGRAMGREAMGEGDVILVGSIGAFLGWQGAVFAFFGGAIYGVIFVLPVMLVRKKSDRDERARAASHSSFEGDEADEMIAAGTDMGVPFGPWIALAGVTWLLLTFTPYSPKVFFARIVEDFSSGN